jgi:hypothetical protein
MKKVEAGWCVGGTTQNPTRIPPHAEGAENLMGGTGPFFTERWTNKPVAPTEVSEEELKPEEGQPPVMGMGRC